jgi:hypothetical protein
MKRQVVMWKESIYRRSFKCACGAKLAEANGEHFEENVLAEKVGFRTWLYCKKCLKPVAFLKLVDISEDAEGLQGNINDYERRKMN